MLNPIAFNLFGLEIRWYGILITLGVLIGLFLARYNCKVKNISFEVLSDIFIVTFPIAIIGARFYYVLFELENYKDNIWNIFNIRQGGLAIHGGIIFAVLTTYIYIRKKKLNFLDFVDVVAPSIILAQGIGRWGNFFNGEAHGEIVTYEFISKFPRLIQKGMFIQENYYNPTFLYESIWNIIVAIILVVILRKSKTKGVTFFTYIGLYSLGRFFIEELRTDSLMFNNIRVAQLVSLIGIILWIGFLMFLKFKRKKQKA